MSQAGDGARAPAVGPARDHLALPPRWVGLLAYACYAAHAAYFLAVDRPSNLLWGCHLASLGVGTGLLLRFPLFIGMGVLSLLWGCPLWILDVLTGGELLPTSLLTHLGGLTLGIYGVQRYGIPRYTWVVLLLTTALLLALSRWLTVPAENVNLAFAAPPGWESLPAYPTFGALLLAGAGAQFLLGETLLRWVFEPGPERPRLARPVRTLALFALGGGCMAALFAVCAPLALAFPAHAWRNRLSLFAGRVLSRFALFLLRVRVDVEGREHLRHPAILTFNHTTTLDYFINAPLAGSRCLVFGKDSLARLPFLGWGWWLGGHPLIRREDPTQWRAAMDAVVERLRRGYSACIAPEGRRSATGELLPFKKGPIHLAIGSRLPIVPIVIEGGHLLLPPGHRLALPGRVRVRILPPIPTDDWSEERLEEALEQLHAVYAAALGQQGASAAATPAPALGALAAQRLPADTPAPKG